jgi:hypothetical protein
MRTTERDNCGNSYLGRISNCLADPVPHNASSYCPLGNQPLKSVNSRIEGLDCEPKTLKANGQSNGKTWVFPKCGCHFRCRVIRLRSDSWRDDRDDEVLEMINCGVIAVPFANTPVALYSDHQERRIEKIIYSDIQRLTTRPWGPSE